MTSDFAIHLLLAIVGLVCYWLLASVIFSF